MSVVTILSQGTANSTNRLTSGGSELVISRIAALLAGADGIDWILNEGAGTKELRDQGRISGSAMGVVKGEGVEANVGRSMRFIRALRANDPHLTVNLAGHSRGSITCYKIAYDMLQEFGTAIPVNIFAIDPVPGNNGRINKENYKHIALGANVRSSFLLLAESEHRLNFRPYVDELYSINKKGHKFDTIPGTHGGINELTGSQSEAAALVLSRALRFLKKNGSAFGVEANRYILDDDGAVRMYSKLMSRIKQYKADASVNPFKSGVTGLVNLGMSSLNVDKHRIANVAGSKSTWGTSSTAVTDRGSETRGRGDHRGLNLSAAIGRMAGDTAHAQRTNRFFANKEHEKLFGQRYPRFVGPIQGLERSGNPQSVAALRSAIAESAQEYNAMPSATQAYFYGFCRKRKVLD
jgi:hypothetical protein